MLLFLFIATQFFRTPYIRKDIQQTLEQFINKLAKKSVVKIPEGFKMHTELPKMMQLDILFDPDIIFPIVEMLSNAEWIVLSNNIGIPLWTSDNPVLGSNDTPVSNNGINNNIGDTHKR